LLLFCLSFVISLFHFFCSFIFMITLLLNFMIMHTSILCSFLQLQLIAIIIANFLVHLCLLIILLVCAVFHWSLVYFIVFTLFLTSWSLLSLFICLKNSDDDIVLLITLWWLFLCFKSLLFFCCFIFCCLSLFSYCLFFFFCCSFCDCLLVMWCNLLLIFSCIIFSSLNINIATLLVLCFDILWALLF
jgi:hypothetical protein